MITSVRVLALCAALTHDVTLGQWSTTETLSPHNGGAVASWDGVLYYSGGDNNFIVTTAVDGYEAATQSWFQFQMPIPRRMHAMTTLDGELFIAGGRDASFQFAFDSVDIYDLETATWRQETMPMEAIQQSAAALNGKVFLAGGAGPLGHIRMIQIYDTATSTWSLEGLDSPGRRFFASAQDDRWVCFAGAVACWVWGARI